MVLLKVKTTAIKFLFLFGCVVLAACATAEYRLAADECTLEGFARYPVLKERMLTYESVWVDELDGSIHCFTEGRRARVWQSCVPGKSAVLHTYPVWVDVDQNSEVRDAFIGQCTAQKCLLLYGNAQCKKT